MEFPISVKSIEWQGYDEAPITPERFFGGAAGAWVAVRWVKDDSDKTYLGVLLGDYKSPSLSYNRETGALTVSKRGIGNPAIWVPDLKRVVMGYESWWGEIKSPDDLRKISDADIQNVWYVKALKELTEAPATDAAL